MANILGKLLVELGVNTTSFLSGMNAASKEAKKTGQEIEHAFDNVGDALSKALGSFGEVGSKISELGAGFNEAFPQGRARRIARGLHASLAGVCTRSRTQMRTARPASRTNDYRVLFDQWPRVGSNRVL